MTDLIVARSEDLESRSVDDELVLLDLRTQRYLSLNRTGAQLWPLIVEGVERRRLVEALRDGHNVAEAVAQRDVDVLVTQLREADLLVAQKSDTAP
ncbi:MAG TPA: PqqD family protein [Acidimicrobiales bacterium]|jgi:hypothetical protein